MSGIDPEFGEEVPLPLDGIESDTTEPTDQELAEAAAARYAELIQENAALFQEIIGDADDKSIAIPVQVRLNGLRLDALTELVLQAVGSPIARLGFAVDYEQRANAYMASLASQIRQQKLAL